MKGPSLILEVVVMMACLDPHATKVSEPYKVRGFSMRQQ